MALLQRNPIITASNLPIYTIGGQKTVLILGLGNPGKEYEKTRHNIGFEVIDSFASKNDFPAWVNKSDLKCALSVQKLGDVRVILCKPTTFMNLSGEAMQAVQHFYKLTNGMTVAVYDELAINFGQIRARVGGEAAGHNGVKSLIGHCGEDFGRLRVGIANEFSKKAKTEDFVLGKFSKEEQENLKPIIQEAVSMLSEYIYGGELPHDTRTVL